MISVITKDWVNLRLLTTTFGEKNIQNSLLTVKWSFINTPIVQ